LVKYSIFTPLNPPLSRGEIRKFSSLSLNKGGSNKIQFPLLNKGGSNKIQFPPLNKGRVREGYKSAKLLHPDFLNNTSQKILF
jgi:hypothetical protein